MKIFERTYRYKSHSRNHGDNPLPDLMTPAMPPLELIEAVRRRVLGLRQRRQLRKLLAFDDRTLSDMGHNRAAILRTLHRPAHRSISGMISNIHLQNMHPEQPRMRH